MPDDDFSSRRDIAGIDVTKSRVICFTSAKGGSGKTVLAASAAWLLMQADCRVIVLDTDFSTRGLSLFLLEALTYSNPTIRPENCLADALLNQIAVDRIRPLVVEQKRGTFEIILPNSNFRLGGAPENALLGLGGGPDDFEVRYLTLLRELCNRLRREYDYIIIDTRGGYDYSSKIPAVLADAYLIVIESDPISVQQVNGLKANIDAFAKAVEIAPNHKGFIINKALYDPQQGEQFQLV
jgi:cellulose biosynthesis protein BcsQ